MSRRALPNPRLHEVYEQTVEDLRADVQGLGLPLGEAVRSALERVEEEGVGLAEIGAAPPAAAHLREELELLMTLCAIEVANRRIAHDEGAEAPAEAAPAPVVLEEHRDDALGSLAGRSLGEQR